MKKTTRAILSIAVCAAAAFGVAPHQAAAQPSDDGAGDPLLLVGGTFAPSGYMDDARAWFEGQGFDVTTMTLAGLLPGSVDIKVSAQAVCDQIAAIRTRTGAATVDVVGHSQGALAVRYCVKYQGGQTMVSSMVSLGGPNYGTDRGSLVCQTKACRQMRPGSSFLTELNAGDDTPGEVSYYHLFSLEEYGGLNGEDIALADGATNVGAQDLCPGLELVHMWEYDSELMRDLIRDAVLQQPLDAPCPAAG
jgi:triacylglycerol esterase/lipase EstA (alpha/beta hydrolase family)